MCTALYHPAPPTANEPIIEPMTRATFDVFCGRTNATGLIYSDIPNEKVVCIKGPNEVDLHNKMWNAYVAAVKNRLPVAIHVRGHFDNPGNVQPFTAWEGKAGWLHTGYPVNLPPADQRCKEFAASDAAEVARYWFDKYSKTRDMTSPEFMQLIEDVMAINYKFNSGPHDGIYGGGHCLAMDHKGNVWFGKSWVKKTGAADFYNYGVIYPKGVWM